MDKALILSKYFLFNEKNEWRPSSSKIVNSFSKKQIYLTVLCRKSTQYTLQKNIPEFYRKSVFFINRDKNSEEAIRLDRGKMLFGVLGIIDEDAIFSFHCHIPLFNPLNISKKSSKIETYGLPVHSFNDIVNCFHVADIHQKNYFELSFGKNFSVKCLNNANTFYQPEEEVRIKKIFKKNLKASNPNDREQQILLFLLFHLLSEVTMRPEFTEIDFWGTFPSSKKDNLDTSISFLKEAIRVTQSGKPRKGVELLIRNIDMPSKHTSRPNRLNWRCSKDFDTLIVNPDLKNKIKEKTICIIDDYITNGYSAEAAKHLLLQAGAKKVVFLALGKFGKRYYSTNYKINGEVSRNYDYTFIDEEEIINKGYNDDDNTEIKKFGDYI